MKAASTPASFMRTETLRDCLPDQDFVEEDPIARIGAEFAPSGADCA